MTNFNALYETFAPVFEKAKDAFLKRGHFSYFKEMPSTKIYGEQAPIVGDQNYQKQLGQKFTRLCQVAEKWSSAQETSPWTGQKLNIEYPQFKNINDSFELALKAQNSLKKLSIKSRAALLFEALESLSQDFFELSKSIEHTTGQGFMMAFQAGGPHALDRCLEAMAAILVEAERFPEKVEWVKPMGPTNLEMSKSYQIQGRGLGLIMACSTFPVWNSLPSVFANLLLGNANLVKPHPTVTYPLALCVSHIQNSFKKHGVDSNACLLILDSTTQPVGLELARDPRVQLIDFTGSKKIGDELDKISGKTTFSEKSGVNCAIVESTSNYAEMINNLAFSMLLYSGQMCTSPQNIFVLKQGITTENGVVSFEQFKQDLASEITKIAEHPKMGAGTLGALQNEQTIQRLEKSQNLGKVILAAKQIANFPRVYSPLVLELDTKQKSVYHHEHFGPIFFVIPVSNQNEALEIVAETIEHAGSLSFIAYTKQTEFENRLEEKMHQLGVNPCFNLKGMVWVNQNAAFSDFHATGANPAANTSIVDPLFVLKRMYWAQSKRLKA